MQSNKVLSFLCQALPPRSGKLSPHINAALKASLRDNHGSLSAVEIEGRIERVPGLQLGLNCGGGSGGTSEIRLRLRHANSKNEFLPYTSILGTMLHELCHNHIGPHNQSFYALLTELQKVRRDVLAPASYCRFEPIIFD